MTWALVFSGQGTQHAEMLPWLAHDDTVRRLEAELGCDWRSALQGSMQTADNRRTQLLLTGTGCAAWQQLKAHVQPPAVIAGYSVGEMAAFAAAEVFDAATALRLAGLRASCMDAAAKGLDTGLLAIGGAGPGGLENLWTLHGLDCAIRIDTGHAVLGGPRRGLQRATLDAEQRGWRATLLNVALASHTRWMADAADAFARILEPLPMRTPAVALVTNALGRVRDARTARRALSSQIAQTVRWDHCMEAIVEQGVDAVLEIGSGQALARMFNERFGGIAARSADEFRSADAVIRWLERTQNP